MSDILSFASDPDFEGVDDMDIEPGSFWDKMYKAIIKQVKKDGIRKDAIRPGQTVTSVLDHASGTIYYDVAELFTWYFDKNDPRNEIMVEQKKIAVLPSLRDAVMPVVRFNLDDMRDAELIPEGEDYEALEDKVADDMTRHILNWQNWYYDRKEEDELEDHNYHKGMYYDIYIDSDYGDLTNIDNYLDPDVDDYEE